MRLKHCGYGSPSSHISTLEKVHFEGTLTILEDNFFFFFFILDDQFLIAFLRKSKYNQKNSRENIDSFYTIRGTLPAMFLSRDVTPKLQEILKLGYVRWNIKETAVLMRILIERHSD